MPCCFTGTGLGGLLDIQCIKNYNVLVHMKRISSLIKPEEKSKQHNVL